jgi:fluoroquinolone transport system ATP-binding protein
LPPDRRAEVRSSETPYRDESHVMITVDNLTFTYPRSDSPAVRGLRFHIEAGEVFGFLGPSGAGKTTTQNVLIGLLREYEGRIEVMGRELKTWRSDYYEHIGVSFEFPNHYLKLTARENLEYFRSLYRNSVEDPLHLLTMVGLEDAADMRVAEFSKGMKNRLNFARSMIHRPKLWFLDEPTTGLDPINARRIRQIVEQRQQEGTTTFLTTHDMVTADELCDRVAFIADGELEVVDSPLALKRQYGTRSVRVEIASEGESRIREFPLDGLGTNREFLALIREHPIESIHSQETTLESVFIQVTGRSLS